MPLRSVRQRGAAVALVLVAACSDPTAVSIPAIPDDAATEVTFGSRRLILEAYLWRDFMPGPDMDARGLNAMVRARAVDQGPQLPAGLRIDFVWFRNGDAVWALVPQPDSTSSLPAVVGSMSRGGPEWEVGALVDVVARLRDAEGREYFLRADDQRIHATH